MRFLAGALALLLPVAAMAATTQPPAKASATAAITGGTINGATIGATTPGTGAFTTLSTTSAASLGGSLIMPNNVTMQIKDSGGTARQVAWVDPSNELILRPTSQSADLQFQDFSGNVLAEFFATGNLITQLTTFNGLVQVKGHLSGTAGAAPAASGGTLVTGSSDTRGGVTIAGGTTAATITFAGAFASAPFCVLTGNSTANTPAITAASTTAITIGLSANAGGETINWHCMQ